MKKSKYLVLAALAAFALGGCTPEVTPEPSPEPAVVEVTSVTLDKSSEELTVGETLQLNATVNPSNATVKDLVWASSNADVASVSATGLVTAKHSGEAVITATAKGTTIKGSCTVTVSAAPVTGWTDAQKADFTAVLGVEVPFFEGMGIDSDWQYVSYVDDGYIGLASPELEDYTAAYGAFRNVMTAAADFEAMDQYGTKWAAETSKKYYLPENNAAFDALAVVALSVEEETSGYVVYVEMYLSMVEYQSDAFPTDFVAVVFGENTLPALTDAETYYFTAGVDEYFGETYAMIYAVPAEGATIDYATYVTALEAAGFKVSQYDGGEGYVPDTVDLVIESDEIYGYFYGEPDEYLTFELYFGEGGDVPPVPPVGENGIQEAYEAAAALTHGQESQSTYTMTGVITGFSGNSFYMQDGEYGMYVYNSNSSLIEGLEVGLNVTVVATVQCYYGVIETKTVSSITAGSEGTLPQPTVVRSLDELAAVKQNVLVEFDWAPDADVTGYTDKATKNVAGKIYEGTTAGGALTINFNKFSYTAELGDVVNAMKAGIVYNVSGAITTFYQKSYQGTAGACNQVTCPSNTVITAIAA